MSNEYSFSSGGVSSRKYSLDNSQENFKTYSCFFKFSCHSVIACLLVLENRKDFIDIVDIKISFAHFSIRVFCVIKNCSNFCCSRRHMYYENHKILEQFANPFLATVPILYPVKASESQRFSGGFRGFKMGTLARNWFVCSVSTCKLILNTGDCRHLPMSLLLT